MPVASMTGFARSEGALDNATFVWEARSVNGKGLELRFRLPSGLDALEPELRRLAGARLARGNLQISLTVARDMDVPRFTVNEALLADILALSDRLVAAGHAVTPTADGILSIRGVVDMAEPGAGTFAPEIDASRRAALLVGFETLLDALVDARASEGAAIAETLNERLSELSILVDRAEADPARTLGFIMERLRAQVALLLASNGQLDEQRLHGEAAMLASRADIREELDRLRAHVAAGRALLAEGGPVGRRLDFLSQEFNRESNTVCSKSNAASLTAIGLDMKIVVDQFREQVQNIE